MEREFNGRKYKTTNNYDYYLKKEYGDYMTLVGSLSYLFWYKAINLIGVPRGMSLNITYIVWTMIFSKLVLNTDLNFQFVIASLIIFLGVVMLSKKEY